MAPSKQERMDQLGLYRLLMTEIKERTLSIGLMASNPIIPNRVLAKEFCYFQLRMVCECIALSCLVAHGDIEETRSKKFQGEYAADKLLVKLESLHPDFYPYPLILKVSPSDGILDAEKTPHKFLSKSDLTDLVRYCGSKVHRGAMKDYTFTPTDSELDDDFGKIVDWGNQILRLLEQHMIVLYGGQQQIICQFFDPKGDLNVVFAESPGRISPRSY